MLVVLLLVYYKAQHVVAFALPLSLSLSLGTVYYCLRNNLNFSGIAVSKLLLYGVCFLLPSYFSPLLSSSNKVEKRRNVEFHNQQTVVATAPPWRESGLKCTHTLHTVEI